jgi:hypothetical protein
VEWATNDLNAKLRGEKCMEVARLDTGGAFVGFGSADLNKRLT